MNRRTRTPMNHDATTVTPKTPRVHFLPGLANSFLMASRVGTISTNPMVNGLSAINALIGKELGSSVNLDDIASYENNPQVRAKVKDARDNAMAKFAANNENALKAFVKASSSALNPQTKADREYAKATLEMVAAASASGKISLVTLSACDIPKNGNALVIRGLQELKRLGKKAFNGANLDPQTVGPFIDSIKVDASLVGTIIENGVELLIEAVYARAYGKHVGRQAWQQCLDLIDKSKIVDMRKQAATKTRTNGRAQTNWTGGVEAGKRAVASPLS